MSHTLPAVVFVLLATAASAQDRFMAPLPADAQLQITKDVEYGKSSGQSARR
ncbi:MAG: hypothetical protein H0W18_11515, partial [Acidobacteria bacterium]|nr:hypothetical protein [Acidobacteriota bacterium]